MKSVLDSSFRYTPSTETDVRKTFDRIRREQLAETQNKGQQTGGSTGTALVSTLKELRDLIDRTLPGDLLAHGHDQDSAGRRAEG